jgi:hypothetical protein
MMLENPIALAALICLLLGLVLSGFVRIFRCFCGRINRITDYFPRQLRCYLPAGAILSACWVNEQDFLNCARSDGSRIDT